ncbi:hypothetical protein G5V58_00965 [Nocardioides anomalus]|uniref:Uncharacterized protein n=1 Tax=Nocardioides anomalus TaxID=2712223 RepID=A0A6G6W865_9ACTN|nr:hypothetical protein [Nocardioides anomalus]QIG41528.1 hypothetical protein G5V58_00965 [Nocardioides anomalus]
MAGQEGLPGSDPSGGARRGARRGPRPRRTFRPDLALLGAGSLLTLLAWVVLVWLAIGAGRDARGGESGRWTVLVLCSVGAVVCLFGCLWLLTALLRAVGVLEQPTRKDARPHRH